MESLEGSEEAEDQSLFVPGQLKKRYVKSSVNIHDRNQLETAFDYKLSSLPTRKAFWTKSNKPKLQVEVFLFFPPGMGISSQSYSKQQFYEDLNPHLRLREPKLNYKELLGLKKPEQSPLLKIKSILVNYDRDGSSEHISAAIECTRVFACSFSAYFLKRIQRRCKKLEKAFGSANGNNQQLIKKALAACEPQLYESTAVLKEWWQLYQQTIGRPGEGITELGQEMMFALEYCHYRFREGLSKLIQTITDLETLLPPENLLIFKKRFLTWVRLQRIYSQHFGFIWLNEKASESEREHYFSKLNGLKKRMWQNLYLEVKPRKAFLIKKQFAYMLAAGFAAIWALMADLWIRVKLPTKNGINEGIGDFLEFSGFLVIIAFVMAYILKDRIKETARSRLNEGILGTNPDYSEQILWKDSKSKAHSIGTIQEWMRFIDQEKNLPQEVMQLRQVHGKTRIFSGEQVVCYRKTIELKRSALLKIPFSSVSLRDIIRINITRYITRLGNPVSSYLCLSEKHGSVVLPMPKSYYLDMVLRYSYQHLFKKPERLALDFNRLVLNKDGLVRIEKL